MSGDFDFEDEPIADRPPDPKEDEAYSELTAFFEKHREQVFFSRQIEIQYEDKYFHWVTNRAIRHLRDSGSIKGETRPLASTGTINLLWHKGNRYYRREAVKLIKLVNEYSDPNIAAAIGLNAELLVLEGFARHEFVMKAREAREYGGKVWVETGHDLEFVFERDGQAYGMEVKNALGYMDHKEFQTKIRMCAFLGIKPVFVARMMPKSWIREVGLVGGFALILKYQLYPQTHRDLAKRVQAELGLPVDAPRALAAGTVQRFVNWHEKKRL